MWLLILAWCTNEGNLCKLLTQIKIVTLLLPRKIHEFYFCCNMCALWYLWHVAHTSVSSRLIALLLLLLLSLFVSIWDGWTSNYRLLALSYCILCQKSPLFQFIIAISSYFKHWKLMHYFNYAWGNNAQCSSSRLGWPPELVWAFWRMGSISHGNLNPNHPAHILVTTQFVPSQLFSLFDMKSLNLTW